MTSPTQSDKTEELKRILWNYAEEVRMGDSSMGAIEAIAALTARENRIAVEAADKAVRVELELLLDEIDDMPVVDGHLIPYEEIEGHLNKRLAQLTQRSHDDE